MRLNKFVALGPGLALMAGVAAPAGAHSLKSVEDQLRQDERYVQLMNQPAPGFTLEDAHGKRMSLDDFKDKAVVLNFVYARCKDECPLHSRFIASIQDQINQTPMREQVQFVSIATDTEDAQATAAAMRAYAGTYGLDTANWTFLYRGSGTPDVTIMLAKQYGLAFVPTAEGEQLHGVVTLLIDQSGRLRARYHGLKFKPVNLIIHVGALSV
jgi:protein SCO1/2